jgi:hypothetical protein
MAPKNKRQRKEQTPAVDSGDLLELVQDRKLKWEAGNRPVLLVSTKRHHGVGRPRLLRRAVTKAVKEKLERLLQKDQEALAYWQEEAAGRFDRATKSERRTNRTGSLQLLAHKAIPESPETKHLRTSKGGKYPVSVFEVRYGTREQLNAEMKAHLQNGGADLFLLAWFKSADKRRARNKSGTTAENSA